MPKIRVLPNNLASQVAAEVAEFVDDRGSEPDAGIGADGIGLKIVPIDFRTVGDLVEKGFEKACRETNRRG